MSEEKENIATMPLDKRFFLIAMSILAFAANIVTLYSFVENSTFQATWTFQWIMSISFIILMFFAGLSLIIAAADSSVARFILFVYSFVYGIAASVFYFYWGYVQASSIMGVAQYFGYLLLFGVTVSASIVGIIYVEEKYKRFISYFLGVANISYLFILIDKYVFNSGFFAFVGFPEYNITYVDYLFHWDSFLGEMLILISGAIIFVALILEE